MANISLRAYIGDIEEYINQGRLEEVVAHCRHILKFFPKHVDTYRLLAKAFLESQRYSDATDIFQRVISVVPDDFVSHVGMSIIREDEGNLEGSIWHMERAFEVQPSNAAIRDELRRLYGKRDGMEPPKIRLTRGALARMYAHGDLYQQAIGELRTALADEAQRFDMQVLLARMYHLDNQRVEAAEVCNALISKLPFCLEANRILADILRESDRLEEASVYHNRHKTLDPYADHISDETPTVEEIPDDAVTIPFLVYQPGQVQEETERQPTWASSLGIRLEDDDKQETDAPDWLSEIEQGRDDFEQETDQFATIATEEEEQVSGSAPAAIDGRLLTR